MGEKGQKPMNTDALQRVTPDAFTRAIAGYRSACAAQMAFNGNDPEFHTFTPEIKRYMNVIVNDCPSDLSSIIEKAKLAVELVDDEGMLLSLARDVAGLAD
jgi:hypothetical protein